MWVLSLPNLTKQLDSHKKPWEHLQQYAKITMDPEKRPPVPIPATARPTIRALLLGAVAQTRELIVVSTWTIQIGLSTDPSSNRITAVMNVNLICHKLDLVQRCLLVRILTLNIVYIRPKVGCSAVAVRRYEDPYLCKVSI